MPRCRGFGYLMPCARLRLRISFVWRRGGRHMLLIYFPGVGMAAAATTAVPGKRWFLSLEGKPPPAVPPSAKPLPTRPPARITCSVFRTLSSFALPWHGIVHFSCACITLSERLGGWVAPASFFSSAVSGMPSRRQYARYLRPHTATRIPAPVSHSSMLS